MDDSNLATPFSKPFCILLPWSVKANRPYCRLNRMCNVEACGLRLPYDRDVNVGGMRTLKAIILGGFAMAGLCIGAGPLAAQADKAYAPIPAGTLSLMAAKETDAGSSILLRIFKKESELEIWKMSRAGRYVLVKTFPICRWSGQLGPKLRTGDRQAPEGFYAVPDSKMNPNSSYHLSFDLGYPNAYDRAHGGTGSFLMVHGICSSMGCYAMTNPQISEIYALAREAFAGGQRAFQVQAYPFRMTAQNMARARQEQHIGFWKQLKEGYDRFEATGEELAVGVRDGRYTFAPSRNATREAAAQARLRQENDKIAGLIADGSAAVRITYQDGGQNAVFASLARNGFPVGEVSRPESLLMAGREVVIVPARKKAPVLIASAAPPPRLVTIGLGIASDQLAHVFLAHVFAPNRLGELQASAPRVMSGAVAILPASWSPPARAVLAQRGA